MARRNWSRDELIVAFNLYCQTPFGKIHNRNPEIIALAKTIGRTPSAVSWKLANFARLDPTLHARKLRGATHGGAQEEQIWREFYDNWDKLVEESELVKQRLFGENPQKGISDDFPEGRTRISEVSLRVNHGFFRSAVLASYDCRCCITGLSITSLLCASHIVPWKIDVKNRTNPSNGLCLNALHDRAFDRGLITVDPDYKIRVSPSISPSDKPASEFLLKYSGIRITPSRRFRPDKEFLKYHNEFIFRN